MKNNNLHQWLNNELSDDEFKKSSDRFNDLKKISHYTSYLQTPKLDVNKALEEFNKQKKQKKGKVINFKNYYKIAAVVLLLIVPAFYLYTLNITTNINTTIAETTIFNLPDASEVQLSANSKIRYKKGKWKSNRNLTLEGEAYFKVQKGKKFTVKTTVGNVSVLGTQFNVKQRKNIFEVVCYEGAVKVVTKTQATILQPGQLFQLINNKQTNNNTTKLKNPSWIHQESSFTNVPFIEVLEELKIYYPVKIDLKNINKQQLFTGAFTHKDLNIALKTITIPLGIKYNLANHQLILYK